MRPAFLRLCFLIISIGAALCVLALPLADAVTMAAYVYGEVQP